MPPSIPQQEEYRIDPWAGAYEQHPLNMPLKRLKEATIAQKDHDVPVSFFERASKRTLTTPGQISGRQNGPNLINQFTNQRWLIDEEHTLLWAMEEHHNGSIHQPNWEMISTAINCFSGQYRKVFKKRDPAYDS